jgi:hypothetical protein
VRWKRMSSAIAREGNLQSRGQLPTAYNNKKMPRYDI